MTDDTGKSERRKIAVIRVLYVHRYDVDHQLYVRYDRAESVSDQHHRPRDADQRHRGQSGERSVPKFGSDLQSANDQMRHPGNAERRYRVCRAEHSHRTVQVSKEITS